MTRREFMQSIVATATGLAYKGSHSTDARTHSNSIYLPYLSTQRPKPNVLFILADDLRPELGCYGVPTIISPNIDALAASGMQFTHTYCQQSLCAPSRSSILSGYRPDSIRIYYNNGLGVRTAAPNALTLPQHFKNNGYTTISLGKIYHNAYDDTASWNIDERPGGKGAVDTGKNPPPSTWVGDVPDQALTDGKVADAAIAILQQQVDSNSPFFLAVGFWKPHAHFAAPKKYWDLYNREDMVVPNINKPLHAPRIGFADFDEIRLYADIPRSGDIDPEKMKELIHGYYACVSYVDAQIGRILRELDLLGLRDNTIVIMCSDHGYKLGEYGEWCKHTNFELDLRVPMIIRAPIMAHGHKCTALTECVDIYPTLADLCGIGIPPHCAGKSMRALLANPDQPWKTAAYSQCARYWNDLRFMGYSLRTERWRYTEWIDIDKRTIISRELYDHSSSPVAPANLAFNADYSELVRQLSVELFNYHAIGTLQVPPLPQ